MIRDAKGTKRVQKISHDNKNNTKTKKNAAAKTKHDITVKPINNHAVLSASTTEENNISYKIGYCRVSTKDQNLDAQTQILKNFGCKEVFQEKISGAKSSFERPVLKSLIYGCKEQNFLPRLRKNDVLVVSKLDRLGRSTLDVLQTIKHLDESGFFLIVIDNNINTMNSFTSKIILTLYASFAELERDLIRARTQEGLKLAKEKGVILGRKRGSCSSKAQEKKKNLFLYMTNNKMGKIASYKDLAAKFNVSKSTIRDLKKKNNLLIT